MSSTSTHENYGIIDAQKLNIENQIVSNHGWGHTTVLKFADASASKIITIPTVVDNAELLTTESDLNAQKMKLEDLTALTAIANDDEVPFVDVSDADAKKKITFQHFVNSIESNINGAAGVANIRISDASGNYENRLMNGDASLSTVGAITLTDKPALKGVAETNKFMQLDPSKNMAGVNEFGCADLTVSAAIGCGSVVSSGDISCADVSCDDVSSVNTTCSGELRLGTDKWKVRNSGNYLQFLEYNGTSWIVKFQVQGDGQGSSGGAGGAGGP